VAEQLPKLTAGTYFNLPPNPILRENCTEVPAGPVQFVVEHRQLTKNFGATLHVLGAADDAEHLRFDCFDGDAHYHYIRHGEGDQHVFVIDQVAEGEPIPWAVRRVRERLPEMLEHAGASDLAAQVKEQRDTVAKGIDEIEVLLEEARARAIADRGNP
jgi:hypothetical protein